MRNHKLRLMIALGLLPFGSCWGIDLTFRLACHPDSVALQFDVSSIGTTSFGEPSLQGVSPHVVESSVVSSGATRFVVYSTTGLPISSTGEMLVTFSSPGLADGMLTVSGVMASDANGQQKVASPNCLPVVVPASSGYRSQQVGMPSALSATAYDLDGQMVSMTFTEDDSPFSTVFASKPATTTWTPASSGIKDLSITATDLVGWTTTASLGQIRAYDIGELTNYAAFTQIHYGSGTFEFDADTLSIGIDNGIAHLLAINPHSPDRSHLPDATVETVEGQRFLVMRFTRRTAAPDSGWTVWESGTLADGTWSEVGVQTISQTDLGNGLTQVTIRRPLGATPPGKLFLQLEATP